MPDVAPPKPPTPKAAGQSLAGLFKGKKPIFYVASGGAVLAIALYVRHRESARADSQPAAPDDGSMTPLYGEGDSSYYPSGGGLGVGGSYGGYDSPPDTGPSGVGVAGQVPGGYVPDDGSVFVPGIFTQDPPTGGGLPPSPTPNPPPPPAQPAPPPAPAPTPGTTKSTGGYYTDIYISRAGKVEKWHHYTSGSRKGDWVKVDEAAASKFGIPAPYGSGWVRDSSPTVGGRSFPGAGGYRVGGSHSY